MIIFHNIEQYLNIAKVNDIIIFGGRSRDNKYIHSIKYKEDTFKVVKVENNILYFRKFRCRTIKTTNILDQQVGLLTKKEFNNLTTL